MFQLPAGALGIAAGIEKREVSGYDRPNLMDQQALTSSLAGNSHRRRIRSQGSLPRAEHPCPEGHAVRRTAELQRGVAPLGLLATSAPPPTPRQASCGSRSRTCWPVVPSLKASAHQPWATPSAAARRPSTATSTHAIRLHGAAATNPAVRANACAAAGVPATFRQVNQAGTPVPAQGAQTPFPFSSGAGNTSLTPETAETRTLGLVYNPSFVPGLNVALDWFDIRIENRITAVSSRLHPRPVLRRTACRVSAALIKRDPVYRPDHRPGARQRQPGQGLDRRYRLRPELPHAGHAFGQFRRAYAKPPTSIRTSSSRPPPRPRSAMLASIRYYRIKSNLNLDWSMGNWSASWGTRFMSGVEARRAGPSRLRSSAATRPTPGTAPRSVTTARVSQSFHDVSAGYAFPWKGKLMAGINNVFTKKPRFNYNAARRRRRSMPDIPLDRFFYVRYNQAF